MCNRLRREGGGSEVDALLIEPDHLDWLARIEKQLYGDGSALSEGARRDLANSLNLLLGQIRDLNRRE